MLFLVSPVSISSFRLMVMVLVSKGDSGAEGFEDGVNPAGADDVAVLVCAPVSLGLASSGAVLAGSGSSGPISGGSPVSEGVSWTGRVTITVSPASLDTPPASARTSKIVTGLSA